MNPILNLFFVIYIFLSSFVHFHKAFRFLRKHISLFRDFKKRYVNSSLKDYDDEIETPIPIRPASYIGEEHSEWDGYMVIINKINTFNIIYCY